jgi:hypothetical protein
MHGGVKRVTARGVLSGDLGALPIESGIGRGKGKNKGGWVRKWERTESAIYQNRGKRCLRYSISFH